MTVCIAAICNRGESIVALCDQQVSTVGWSADTQATKMSVIAKNWWLGWAAEDVTKIPPILDRIKKSVWGDRRSAQEVSDALSNAYQRQIKETAEQLYLARFGLDMESFLEGASSKLTAQTFDTLAAKIATIELECELMAFGFDREKGPQILILHPPGIVDRYNAKNSSFGAIGSGSYRADSTLYFHGVGWTTPLPIAIYHLCESKFMAESASGVGKSTIALILTAGGGLIFLREKDINAIRKIWEKKGKPRVPRQAGSSISTMIQNSIRETQEIMEEARKRDELSRPTVSSPSPSEP